VPPTILPSGVSLGSFGFVSREDPQLAPASEPFGRRDHELVCAGRRVGEREARVGLVGRVGVPFGSST